MFEQVLTNYRFTEHSDGNGYDAIEVFVDAEAAEKFYATF